jgi:hypothetical protein
MEVKHIECFLIDNYYFHGTIFVQYYLNLSLTRFYSQLY